VSTKLVTDRDRLLLVGLLLAIFFIGLALRLYELDADSLWFDEIYSASRAQEGMESLLTYSVVYQHPPLADIVTWFVIAVFGKSDFVLRLPAVLFGSLSILLTYKVGTTLWTSQVGLIGAFLLAVNPYHVQHSQQARPYALMIFLALLSLIFLLRALQTNRKRLWLGFVVCTSLSLYTHYFAFLFMPAEVVFAAWVIAEDWMSAKKDDGETPPSDPVRRFSLPAEQALMSSLSLALVGLSYLPWLARLQAHSASVALPAPTAAAMALSFESSLSFLREVVSAYSGGDGLALLLWLGLFLFGLITCDRKRIALLVLWVGLPFGFLAVIFTWHFLNPRYLLFALPLYVLAIAKGIVAVSRWFDRHLRKARHDYKWLLVLIPTLAALILGVFNVAPLRAYYLSQNADWRAAARYLAANMAPEDIILADGKEYLLVDDYWVDDSLSYYFGSHSTADPQILQARRQLWDHLQNVRHDQGEVWAVLGYKDRPRSWNRIEQITVTDFHDVPIVRLREPSGHVLQDTVSMLEILLELLPPEAQFDVHLALAEIHLRTEAFEEARFELEMASQVQPDDYYAPRALADTFADLERLSHAEDVQMQRPLWHSLGDVIAFLGYSTHPIIAQAGGTVHITLFWQALAEMERDYSVFIHVIGPDDRRWAQADRLLRQVQHGGYTTSSWQVEEIVREEYELELAPEAPLGEYIVRAGIYYWENGERLAVWDENGQRVLDDTVLLEPITVTP
jgi:mannosyltransferase